MRFLAAALLVALAVGVDPAAAATPTCEGSAPHVVRAGKAVTIAVHCWDVEEDDIRIDLATVVNGTATLSANGSGDATIAYVPAEPGPGSVGFVGTELPGEVTGTAGVANFEVTSNHPPVCATDTPHAASGATVAIALGCSDPDVQDGALGYVLTETPLHGTAVLDEGTVGYTAAPGFAGSDGFAFTASDGTATTVARRRVHLGPGTVCDPAAPAPVVRPGRSVTFTLDCTTPAGAVADVAILSGPEKGALTVSGRLATYRAFAGQSGADAFAFGDGTTQALVLDGARNDPPVCTGLPATARAGDVLTWTPACSDPEGDAITTEITAGPAHGLASVVAGVRGRPALAYLAPRVFAGADALKVRAVDARGAASEPVRVPITVRERLRPGCRALPAVTVRPGAAVVIPIRCADFIPLAGDAFRLGRAPQRGTVTVNPNGVTYFASSSAGGSDPFTVLARNDVGDTQVSVSVTVAPARRSPPRLRAKPARRRAALDVPDCTPPAPLRVRPGQTVTLPGLSCDRSSVQARVLGQPALGQVAPAFELDAAAERRYTAGAVEGTDTVVYAVRADGLPGPPVTQTVTVTAAANSAPRCLPGLGGQPVTGQTTVLAPSCADAEGDPLTYVVVLTPAHGTLEVGTGRVAYTPAAGYAGPDSFVLDALDDHGGAARLVQYRVSVSPRGTSAQRRPSPRR